METEDIRDERFERFVRRTMPRFLLDGPPPHGWDGDAEAWSRIRVSAREHFRDGAAFQFMEALSLKGWTADELATGVLQGRASVSGVNAMVQRTSTFTPPELRDEADRVLTEASAAGYKFDELMRFTLRSISGGTFASRNAGALLADATRDLAAFRSAAAVRRAEAMQSVEATIEVGSTFRAIGKTWPAGRIDLSKGNLGELLAWKSRMEAQAAHHGWPAPEFPGQWPPFNVVTGGPPPITNVPEPSAVTELLWASG